MQNSKLKNKCIASQYNQQTITTTILSIQKHYYDNSALLNKQIAQTHKKKRKASENLTQKSQKSQDSRSQCPDNKQFFRKMIYDNKRLTIQYDKLLENFKDLQKQNQSLKKQIQETKNKIYHRSVSINNLRGSGNRDYEYNMQVQNIWQINIIDQLTQLQHYIKKTRQNLTCRTMDGNRLQDNKKMIQRQIIKCFQQCRKIIRIQDSNLKGNGNSKGMKQLQEQNKELRAQIQKLKRVNNIKGQKVELIRKLLDQEE